VYSFNEINFAATYRLMVESKTHVGITNWSDAIQLQLGPDSAATRDLDLPRACRVEFLVVDEKDRPLEDVRIYPRNLADKGYSSNAGARTDAAGRAEVGGLAESADKYQFAFESKHHVLAKCEMLLDEAGGAKQHTMRLASGVAVGGIALCNDGKPARGWSVSALPEWWKFAVQPGGVDIDATGNFVFPHVGDDDYRIAVSVPMGDGMSSQHVVLVGQRLPPKGGVLHVNIDLPSPEAMGAISGTLKFEGGTPARALHVSAHSMQGSHHSSTSVAPGKTEFEIPALPPGQYRVTVESNEIDEVRRESVVAPSDGLEISVKVRGPLRIAGRVVDPNGEAIKLFRVRAVKTGYTRGPNYVQDSAWQSVEDNHGRFDVALVGPGIYRVDVEAKGWSITSSASMDADDLPSEPINLELSRGATVSGTVVDEQGRPVDGAVVAPRSGSAMVIRDAARRFGGDNGGVRTANGKFELRGLPKGNELLRVTHPDYCFAFSDEFAIADSDIEIEPLVLRRGATVRGTAYDGAGEPRANVGVVFHDSEGYSGGGDEEVGMLA
ncbi:MAG: carboxypeptidase regulatory-like domain-containing protein, partial [Planctomycetales bacterium]|nr:carboxypeptidase regulatory-like domain-containing protein [Planctomycetales bacterium]